MVWLALGQTCEFLGIQGLGPWEHRRGTRTEELDIPLYKRDWSRLWMILASIAVAWLFRRPTSLPDIALTCVLGGMAIWLTLGPGLNALKYHRSRLVQYSTLTGCIILCIFVMRTLIPWLLMVLAK